MSPSAKAYDMTTGNADYINFHKDALLSVGWFLPPYVSLGYLSNLVRAIKTKGDALSQDDLERFLDEVYSPDALAAMVVTRYPETPFVRDYQEIIAEAVEAHFMGLHHVAVSGLLPVVEGASKRLARLQRYEILRPIAGLKSRARGSEPLMKFFRFS